MMGATRVRLPTIFGNFSDDTLQEFALNDPTPIQFNTTGDVVGLKHDNVINNSSIEVVNQGIYNISLEPQIGRKAGSNIQSFNIFIQKSTDHGLSFDDIPNSNIKVTIANSNEKIVVPLSGGLKLQAGDIFRLMASVEDDELVLNEFPATLTPKLPATPSVILTVDRLHD